LRFAIKKRPKCPFGFAAKIMMQAMCILKVLDYTRICLDFGRIPALKMSREMNARHTIAGRYGWVELKLIRPSEL